MGVGKAMPELFNNRYRVLRALGKGGMAEVLLAEDTQAADRLVAIKTYTVTEENESDFELFEREFMMLSSLSHPHINTVFDYGHLKAQKKFFFSAAFVDGVALDEFAKCATFEEILLVTAQILEALDYLHIKGVLHFDIKPANIIVTRDTKTKQPHATLLDMGISIFEKERRDRGTFGTPNYMAPEIILRQDFDHRADLFSFGATLYKIIYGRTAFPGTQAVDVHKKVLTLEPEFAPAPRFPKAYLRICQKLLNKHPDERFYSSREVLDALQSAFPNVFPHKRREHARRLTKSISLIGREIEITYLLKGPIDFVTTDAEVRVKDQDAIIIKDGAARTVPKCVSIVGPEGVGKSRLLKEARVRAQTALATTLSIDGKNPHDIFEILNDIRRILNPSGMDDQKPQKTWDEFLTEGPVSASQSALLSLKDKIFAFAGQLIQNAGAKNLLILVDGYEALTDMTKELVSHLAKLSNFFLEEMHFRLGVITASQTEAVKDAHILELQNFSSEKMTAEYLKKSLAVEAIPSWLSSEVHSISKGNPRFIEELASSLLDNNIIRIEKGYITFDGETIPKDLVPREIEDAYRKRLAGIPPHARKVLELVSLFENKVPLNALIDLFDLDRAKLFDGIQFLLERHFILLDPLTKNIAVENAVFKKVAHESIDVAERIAAHRKIFDYLYKRNFTKDEESLSEAAHQALWGEECRQAFILYSKLGRQHFERLRLKKAIEAYETALAASCDTGDSEWFSIKIQIMQDLVSCYWTSGERTKALRLLNNLSNIPFEDAFKKAEILLLLAELHKDQGDSEKATQTLASYRNQFLNNPKCGPLTLRFFNLQAVILMIKGLYSDASDLLKKGLTEIGEHTDFVQGTSDAEKQDLDADLFQTYSLIGQALDIKEDFQPALDFYTRAEALIDRASIGILDQCKLLSRLGILYERTNKFEKAECAFTQALEKATLSFFPKATIILNLNMGNMYQNYAQIEKALERYEIARRQARSLGLKPQIAYVSLNLGVLQYFIGLLKSSGEHIITAYEICEETGNHDLKIYVINALIDHFRICGKYDEAMGWAKKGVELITQSQFTTPSFELWLQMLEVGFHLNDRTSFEKAATEITARIGDVTKPAQKAQATYLLGRYKLITGGQEAALRAMALIKQALQILLSDTSPARALERKEQIYRYSKFLENLVQRSSPNEAAAYHALAENTLSELVAALPPQYRETFLKNMIRISGDELRTRLQLAGQKTH